LDTLSWSAKLYLSLLGVFAFLVGGTLVVDVATPSMVQLTLAASLVVVLAIAFAFPILIAPKTKLSLHTGIVFAATLLFLPGVAVLIALVAIIIADIFRREPPEQTLFNAAQLVLQIAVGGTLLRALGWDFNVISIASPLTVLGILATAAVMTLIELATVSGMVGLHTRRSPFAVFRELLGFDPWEWLTQLALGVLGAIIVNRHPWALPLLVPPALILYRANQRQVRLLEQAELLEYQAFHDALTGLPNRALLLDRLQHALARSAREGSRVGVLFLDLDGFKAVNDRLGHAAGDEVLRAVAGRLIPCLRPGDTVARFGGDEFVVLLDALPDVDAAKQVAERIEHAIRHPLDIDGEPLAITTSIGVAISGPIHEHPDALLQAADEALYEAKVNNKASYVISDRSLHIMRRYKSRMYGDVGK
jgi:diguanylate cyclase (GGDEF)-like protein